MPSKRRTNPFSHVPAVSRPETTKTYILPRAIPGFNSPIGNAPVRIQDSRSANGSPPLRAKEAGRIMRVREFCWITRKTQGIYVNTREIVHPVPLVSDQETGVFRKGLVQPRGNVGRFITEGDSLWNGCPGSRKSRDAPNASAYFSQSTQRRRLDFPFGPLEGYPRTSRSSCLFCFFASRLLIL